MGKHKSETSAHHRLFMWLTSYLRIAIVDLYRAYLYLITPKRRKRLWVDINEFSKIYYRRFTAEKVLKESGSLTYITILGFVPFVTFLVLIAPDLPFLNLSSKFQTIVAKNFIPGSADAIMSFVDEMIARRKIGFNIFNFVIMIVSSYSLFKVIRDTFDRILSMQLSTKNDLITQVVKFLGTIVFGLFIMVIMFSSSSLPLVSSILKIPLLRWLLLIVPFVMQFLGLLFMYMLLPSVRIKRSSLFRGAFWTTVVWVSAKALFDVYIYNLTSVQAIYGVMAALPIFLMWVYLNWAIILGGIVLVSVLENPDRDNTLHREPQRAVRITLEMFSNQKLNERLQAFVDKKELIKMIEDIQEEKDK